ncbi:MAG: hypothetical protein OXR66_02420 [Candidatus Woesearchaeota archaeon]|nr:hypothetical protein [Candidatus Woesearchaeota archaeon]
MRVLVFGKEKEQIIPLLQGLELVQKDPEIVLCWGGDGTFLLAEHEYPGVPKLLVRHSKTCKKCNNLTIEEVVPRLQKEFATIEQMKLQATIAGTDLPPALNDVVIRNTNQSHAIRFAVEVNGEIIAKEQIGDGVVVSTPFGSTAYFKSITRETFENGIGIAFNNTVEEHDPLITDEESEIVFVVERGEGTVTVDTLDQPWPISQGDRVTIRKAAAVARIVTLE